MIEKDLSLLDLTRSLTKTDSILEKIQRIQNALDKGSPVYTEDELEKLRNMMQEYLKLLKGMME